MTVGIRGVGTEEGLIIAIGNVIINAFSLDPVLFGQGGLCINMD